MTLEHFSKTVTLPTAKYNLKTFDLISFETESSFIIETKDYRVDGYYGKRKIYFGFEKFLKIFHIYESYLGFYSSSFQFQRIGVAITNQTKCIS